MKKIAKSYNDFIKKFEDTTHTTTHRLPNDNSGKLIIVRGIDKPLFGLKMNSIISDYENVFYWLTSTSDKYYVTIRVLDKHIYQNEDELKKANQLYQEEVVKIASEIEHMNKIAEESLKNVKAKIKKIRTKTKTN